MLVEVLISDALATDHVTSRMVDLSINGEPQSPIDAISGPAIFTCSENDALDATVEDFNSAGSTMSDHYTGIATLPQGVPVKPSVTGFLFSAGGAPPGPVGPEDPGRPYVDPRSRRRGR
jgi:hypothetical protein